MDKTGVLAELSHHIPVIYLSIRKGWDEYQEQYKDSLHVHSAWTRSSIIRDHIILNIRENFDNHSNINLFETNNGLFLLQIKHLSLRFKKLDRKFCSSNIPTQQSRSFVKQIPLPTIPESIHLNVGYVPNPLCQDSCHPVMIGLQ